MASRSLPGCPRRVSAPRGPRSPADPPSRPRVHVPSRGAFAVRTALRAHSPGRWVSLVHCSLRFDTFGRAAVAAFRLSSRLRVTPHPARSPQASPWRHTSDLGRTSPPSAPTRSVSRCPGQAPTSHRHVAFLSGLRQRILPHRRDLDAWALAGRRWWPRGL